MARTMPLVTRRDLEEIAANEACVWFVTIRHPNVVGEVRLVTDNCDYQIGDALYHQAWFEIALLTDTDQPPRTQFSFPNTDRSQTLQLEAMTTPARVDMILHTTAWFDLTSEPRALKTGTTEADLVPIYAARYLSLRAVNVTPGSVSVVPVFSARGSDVRSNQAVVCRIMS
ncbi:MAG: hypothetical protein AAFO77_08055, partial [Pseudomonadota bacterium]